MGHLTPKINNLLYHELDIELDTECFITKRVFRKKTVFSGKSVKNYL